jgi:hypothetical protein
MNLLQGGRSMERRFRVRLDELLNDAEVPNSLLRGVLPRLEVFLQPFVDALHSPEQQTNARHYVQGLLSDLDSKDVESIAYLHDRERQGLQKFIGQSEWDYQPLLTELVRQVGTELGEADGVLVFDPSAFAKKGTESVGVQRQWCGRLGKIDNCQVGIYLGYVSRREHALVDFRLYLPKEWANRKRRRKAGVPDAIRLRTRHELILEMLAERGPSLPHAWLSGDDELGRCAWFRQELRSRHECYLLAAPSNTLVRDLTAAEPPYGGHGRQPRVPFTRVDRWCAALAETAWQTVEVRDGESCWWCSASGKGTARGSTTTCCRTQRWTRPRRNSRGCSRRSIGSKNAWSVPKGRPGWPTTKCERGRVGSIIKRYRCWRPGS